MATTLFPDLNVVAVAGYLVVALVVLAAAAVAALRWMARREPVTAAPTPHRPADRTHWRMPPLALLEPVKWSAGTRLGMIALRSYLVLGALLLIVKAIQISK